MTDDASARAGSSGAGGAEYSALPHAVQAYLNRELETQRQPVVLLVDGDFRLCASWGDVTVHGLRALRVGEDVRHEAVFLSGLDTGVRQVMSLVNLAGDRAADVHLLPTDDSSCYVILLAATASMRSRREMQQNANELRLLADEQGKLLERLIETRAELDLRRREAEEANRLKSRFIASMTHEFRTPLTSVIGYAELLQKSLAEEAPASRRHAQAIGRAAQHMATLVDNILEQARLEQVATTARLAPVEPRELLEDLTAILAPLAADKGISFAAFLDPPMPRRLMLDEMRVRQILLNLLGNAVKFTEDGFVHLEMKWVREQLLIQVADSGPGIAPEDRARIFAPFQRLDGSHNVKGAGLGLHITLELVKLLGGSIGLDSEPGKGSRFQVRLPATLVADPPPDHRVSSAPAAPGNHVHVLLAEDDADIVQLLQLYLSRAGYRLSLAADGQEAVRMALALRPEVIVMDLNMPVMGGLEAAQALREGGFAGKLLALTGATMTEERLSAVSSWFDAYVPKPMRMPELLATLQGLAQSRPAS